MSGSVFEINSESADVKSIASHSELLRASSARRLSLFNKATA